MICKVNHICGFNFSPSLGLRLRSDTQNFMKRFFDTYKEKKKTFHQISADLIRTVVICTRYSIDMGI